MDTMIAGAGTVLGLAGGFVAGWLVASEKFRLEVFKRKLDVYQHIVELAAELLTLSVKAELDSEFLLPMVEGRLALADYALRNNLFVTKGVGDHVAVMNAGDATPQVEKIRVAYNEMCQTMAKELRLAQIHATTSV